MKKVFCLGIFLIISIASLLAISTSEWYTINPSTSTPTSPSINKSTVRIRNLQIIQPATTAQTITFYENATSSTTATAVNIIKVPAVAGIYTVFNNLNDTDNIDMPYFAVTTSTTTDPCQVSVLER
jgi:hypothetical protein